MSATDVFNQLSAAIETLGELPLRVFDIKISRKDNDHVCIKLTRGGDLVEVTGKFGKRIKVDQVLVNSKAGELSYSAAFLPDLVTVNVYTHFTLCRYSKVDGEDKWKPLDSQYTRAPSDKSLSTFATALTKVAERILTRFSRVDLQ